MILHIVEMFDVIENHESFLAITVNLVLDSKWHLLNLYARMDSHIWFDKENLGLTIVYIEDQRL